MGMQCVTGKQVTRTKGDTDKPLKDLADIKLFTGLDIKAVSLPYLRNYPLIFSFLWRPTMYLMNIIYKTCCWVWIKALYCQQNQNY